MFNLTFTSFA